MSKKNYTSIFFFISGLIIAAAFARLIPGRPSNFTPIAAMALFGGATYRNKIVALVLPIFAMFISDIFIGFHSTIGSVYLSFTLITLIGIYLQDKLNLRNVVFGSLASSLLFFLITNFAAWYGSNLYPQNFGGLLLSYEAGLAFYDKSSILGNFFLNQIIGDLFFTGLLFGAYALAYSRLKTIEVGK